MRKKDLSIFLDYETDAVITGGILVAAGSSGMAVNFGDNSTQGSILVNLIVRRQEQISF